MATDGQIALEAAPTLALLGPPGLQPRSLSDRQWAALATIARDHRLAPHLHGRIVRGEIAPAVPSALEQEWQAAHRAAGLDALVQRREALMLGQLLAEAGIGAAALKGAWLAWNAYPAPAERPLRDLDLLVAEHDAPEALSLLLSAGLMPAYRLPDDPAQHAALAKQFPPLVSPRGVVVELHAHAWEPPGSMEWSTPPTADAALLNRAQCDETVGTLRHLAPADMLAHLCIHAAYSHRFEVGPLLLPDIDYLLQRAAIDWSAFWRNARGGGYARGAALVLALVDRWRRPGLLAESGCPIRPDEPAVAQASALLVQSPGLRKSTRSFAAFRTALADGGLAAAIAVASVRAARLMREPVSLVRRLGDSLFALGDPTVAANANRSAVIGAWLEHGGGAQ